MKRLSNPILLVLAIVLATSSFFLFRLLLSGSASAYTSEIAAAFLGSLLTIIITAIMLNKQTEVDLRKDRTATILANKLEVYGELMGELKEVMTMGSISWEDVVAVQILNQRIAFIASYEVVKAFEVFAEQFAKAAKDGNITHAEVDLLLQHAGKLSVKIRKDLLSAEELREFHEAKFTDLLSRSIQSLSTKPTTEEGFLQLCSEADRDYFSTLLNYLASENIGYTMGTKGFAVKDSDGTSILWCFPTAAKTSIQVLKENLSNEAAAMVTSFLKSRGIPESKLLKSHIPFKPNELPVQDLCDLLSQIA